MLLKLLQHLKLFGWHINEGEIFYCFILIRHWRRATNSYHCSQTVYASLTVIGQNWWLCKTSNRSLMSKWKRTVFTSCRRANTVCLLEEMIEKRLLIFVFIERLKLRSTSFSAHYEQWFLGLKSWLVVIAISSLCREPTLLSVSLSPTGIFKVKRKLCILWVNMTFANIRQNRWLNSLVYNIVPTDIREPWMLLNLC
jgi:hypothetical protein